jgi:ubiquinone/menaquinone biosynthesis C-methylase UbiE
MSIPPNPLQNNTIDWNKMSQTFDRWLPYIQPVAEALISLADLSEGHQILDVAAGTGEPSLTIARRFGSAVRITAVDGAEAMVAVADEKLRKEGLSGVTFQQMKAEALTFPSNRFDRVISRFGVMLFDDPLQGLKEMRRVMKPGGKMAIAVWSEFHRIEALHLIWELIMKRIPPEARPPLPKMADLGPPGKLQALLLEAGFKQVEIRPFLLSYAFDDFETYWTISTESGTLREPLDRFSRVKQEEIKIEVSRRMGAFQKDGKIVMKNQALLAGAIK